MKQPSSHRYSIFIFLFLLMYNCVDSYQNNEKLESLGEPLIDSESSAKILSKRQPVGEEESEIGSGLTDNEDSTSPAPPDEQNLTSPPSPSKQPPTQRTTETSITTSTTEPSTTTTETPFVFPGEGKTTKPYFCLCDFQVKKCDMNCCCDVDCTEEERTVFTGCSESLIYDPKRKQNPDHSCVKSYIMYRENYLPGLVVRSDKSLFCVAKENLKQEKQFTQQDMARIKNRISHGRIDMRPKYKWDDTLVDKPFKPHREPYKYGSPILILKLVDSEDSEAYQEDMLRFPAPFFTETCSVNEPVKYLHDFTEACTLPLPDLISQCESTKELNVNQFIKNYRIIANPNVSKFNSTRDYVLKEVIISKVCYNNWENCEIRSNPEEVSTSEDDESTDEPELDSEEDMEIPKLTADKKVCKNIMTHLNFTFVHNGTKGISRIIAEVLLKDFSIDEENVEQHFSANFIWIKSHKTNEANNSNVNEDILALKKLPRSGNPGYLVGKPVILGRKMKISFASQNESASPASPTIIERIHVLPDAAQWLHIHGARDCPLYNSDVPIPEKHAVLFGYEQISSCKLLLDSFDTCRDLQQHITSILLGDIDPENMINAAPFVAAYGSPDAFPSDWVPITFIEKSRLLPSYNSISTSWNKFISKGCESIGTSLHITIAYAYVGPVDYPQAKITGVFFEPEETIQLKANEEGKDEKLNEIIVTTTVSFVDVTEKPTTRVATWPVLSIQLPADFFYPFASSPNTPGPSSAADRSGIMDSRTSFRIILLFLALFLII